MKNNQSTSSRQISQLESGRFQGRGGRSGRSSYRGGGQGSYGRSYQGSDRSSARSRGRGHGRNSGRWRHNPNSASRGWRPQNREYNDEEWSQLSYEQRQRVHDLRSYLRENNGDTRRVSQSTNDNSTLPSQVQLPPPSRDDHPPNPPSDRNSVSSQGGRAGDAFSQRSNHNRNN